MAKTISTFPDSLRKKHWSFRKPNMRKVENRVPESTTIKRKKDGYVIDGMQPGDMDSVKAYARAKGYRFLQMGEVVINLIKPQEV